MMHIISVIPHEAKPMMGDQTARTEFRRMIPHLRQLFSKLNSKLVRDDKVECV